MIKVNHYQKAAPEHIHDKKHSVAKKMRYDVKDKNTLHKSSKMAHQNTHKILDY